MLIVEKPELKATEKSKKVYVEIFGFFPYELFNNVENFLNFDLGLKKDEIFTTYQVSGGKTTDAAYLLPMSFNNIKEAESFILNAIKNSDYVNKNMFNDIAFLDVDKTNIEIENIKKSDLKKEEARSIFKNEGLAFCEGLKEKYADNEWVSFFVEDLKSGVFNS